MEALSIWLIFLPIWLSFLLITTFLSLFGIGMTLTVRHFVPFKTLSPQNDISGFVFSVVGVIYGVLLAFVVIDVWEEFHTATEITNQESASAIALYRSLEMYPNLEEASKSLSVLREFTTSVVQTEFPAMQTMQWDSKTQPSLATTKKVTLMWETMMQIIPHNLQEQTLLSQIVEDMSQLTQMREKRLLIARSDLPALIWGAVIIGALITVGFVAVFGHERRSIHIILVILLSIVIASVIMVILGLNYPFSGKTSIQPDGYEYLIDFAKW